MKSKLENTPEALSAAMAQHVYWSQGPSSWLDMFFALRAALEVKP